jgi:hypothetical protein
MNDMSCCSANFIFLSIDDIAKDLCALVRALVLSLRSITAELSKDAPQGDLTSSSADTLAYHKLLRDSLPCFKVFLLNHNPHGPVTRQSLVNASLPALALYNKEEKATFLVLSIKEGRKSL